ncbi:MAG: lamin tail domain-containing protein [Myxococcota bacterium]
MLTRFVNGSGTFTTIEPVSYYADDIVVTCPAPHVTGASATSATEVIVTFDKAIDGDSLTNALTQFVFTNGLTATAAVLSGTTAVKVTTSNQTAAADYTVTVSGVTDGLGQPVDPAHATATFKGFSTATSIGLLIVEVLYNPAGTDTNFEWVKLYNGSGADIDLSSWSLGWGGDDYTYGTLQLTGTVNAGACFIVGGPSSDASNGSPVYGQAAPTGKLNMQNTSAAAGDGVALFNVLVGAIAADTVPKDAVVYGVNNSNNMLSPAGTPFPSAIVPDAGSGKTIVRTSSSAWAVSTGAPNSQGCIVITQ